jgi:hypothetical protein
MHALAVVAHKTRLEMKRSEFMELMTQFPRGAAICEAIIRQIESDLQKLAAGRARYRGVWQSRAAPADAMRSAAADQAGLTIFGITYDNIEIKSLADGTVLFNSNKGYVTLPLAGAPSELLEKIRARLDLFNGFNPISEFMIGSQTLKHAMLVGDYGDSVIILHDDGVVRMEKAVLSEVQLDSLIASCPNPPPIEGKLVLIEGEGPRDAKLGWAVTAAEKQQWKAAGEQPFSKPLEFSIAGKRIRGFEATPGTNSPPTYQQTLNFINSKISPYVLGYNKASQCIVVCKKEGDAPIVKAAFREFGMEPAVQFEHSGVETNILLSTRLGFDGISVYSLEKTDANKPRLWRNYVSEIRIPLKDAADAPTVTTAFRYLMIWLRVQDTQSER